MKFRIEIDVQQGQPFDEINNALIGVRGWINEVEWQRTEEGVMLPLPKDYHGQSVERIYGTGDQKIGTVGFYLDEPPPFKKK